MGVFMELGGPLGPLWKLKIYNDIEREKYANIGTIFKTYTHF